MRGGVLVVVVVVVSFARRATTDLGPAPPPRPELSFYMYSKRALDFSFLRRCRGYDALVKSTAGEGMQEAHLYDQLKHHPYRTRNASAASLFYIPIWEYTSFRMQDCLGTTHRGRMRAAGQALVMSPHFMRSAGRNHFWASSKSHELADIHSLDIYEQLTDKQKRSFYGVGPNAKNLSVAADLTLRLRLEVAWLLSETSVGRMKPFGRMPNRATSEWKRHPSVVARCTFDMGHQPNQYALLAFTEHTAAARRAARAAATLAPRSDARAARDIDQHGPPFDYERPVLVYFAGGLDVCCTGKDIRCQVGQLLLESSQDVLIRPAMRESVSANFSHGKAPQCLLRAVTALAKKRRERVSATLRSLLAATHPSDATRQISNYERMGREMATSRFCLCPAGDICTTSRFVTSIAAGCIPVVICDGLEGPYGKPEGSVLRPVPYDDFWIKLPAKPFVRDPRGVVRMLRSLNHTEVRRRQAALAKYRGEILLQAEGGWAAATHFLEEVADCVAINREEPIGKVFKKALASWPNNTLTRAVAAMSRPRSGGGLGTAASALRAPASSAASGPITDTAGPRGPAV